MKRVNLKAFIGSSVLLIITAGVIFISAQTFDYWQAWVFLTGGSFI